MIMKGDVSLDFKIDAYDVALCRAHLLGFLTLTGDAFSAADVNDDNNIDGQDLAAIRMHQLGVQIITEVVQ